MLYVLITVAWIIDSCSGFSITQAGRNIGVRKVTLVQSDYKTAKKQLLTAITRPQNINSRRAVEQAIDQIAIIAKSNKANLLKPLSSGVYWTRWTSTSADSLLGMGTSPSLILGGKSFQTIGKERKRAENVVYWKAGSLGVRMVGIASISTPLPSQYTLTIKGLQFRYGASSPTCPEQLGLAGDDGKVWTPLLLPEGQELQNGKGTLEILYNDGNLRVTKDENTGIMYVHDRV